MAKHMRISVLPGGLELGWGSVVVRIDRVEMACASSACCFYSSLGRPVFRVVNNATPVRSFHAMLPSRVAASANFLFGDDAPVRGTEDLQRERALEENKNPASTSHRRASLLCNFESAGMPLFYSG
jgi:hypothetical protein